jgi:Tfp pilus assembly protein PilW
MSSERGFTITEMLVSIIMFVIVLTAILQMVQVTLGNQADISRRVSANQRGRPVMTRIINDLRSGCVSPGIAPVLAGSSATSMTYLSGSGSDVSPIPDKHTLTLTGTTLSDTVAPGTGGTAPSWTFGTASTQPVLTNVTAAKSGATTLPLFRYYSLGYVSGKLVPVAQAVPLSSDANAANAAAKTALVSVAFGVGPNIANSDVREPNQVISFTDSASLRLEAGSPDISRPNLPCV